MLREALLAAAVLNAVMVACSMSLFAVPVLAPAIAADLGVETTLVGVYSGILWAASVATSFSAGPLIARFGAMGVSRLCVGLCAIGLACAGFGTLPAFFCASVAIGLAHGIETPASSQLLARLTAPRDQPLVFSLKQTGVQIGGMASGVLFPVLLVLAGWRAALWAYAAVLVVGVFALAPAGRRFDRGAPSEASRPRGSMWSAVVDVCRDPPLRRLTIAALLFVGAQVCFNTFLVSFLVRERGLGLALAGTVLTVGQSGGLVGRILWGVIAARHVPASALLAALGVVMVVALAILGLAGTTMPMPALLATCFVVGLSLSGWNGIFLAEVARLSPPDQVGRITGATFAISAWGLVVGPMIFGAIAAQSTFATAYLNTAAWVIGGLAALAWRGRRARGT